MEDKKTPAKFTIRFKPSNPRHQQAIQMLNEAGPGNMAALIADALCMYAHYGTAMVGDLVSAEKHNANPVRLQCESTDKATPEDVQQPHPILISNPNSGSSGAGEPSEDDMWDVVNDSLGAFFDSSATKETE